MQSLDNAVTDAIFSVGARVHSPPDPHQNWFPQDGSGVTVTRRDVPPLVTVRPHPDGADGADGRTDLSAFGPSPYRNQELLLGARVYTVPRFTARTAAGKPPSPSDDGRPGVRVGPLPYASAPKKPTITGRCPAGSELYLWAPHLSGTARLADGSGPDGSGSDNGSGTAGSGSGEALTGRFRSDQPVTKIAPMQRLGTVGDDGRFRIELSPNRTSLVPDGAVGCLDTGRLRTAVDGLKATGATGVSVSDGTIRAELPSHSTGIAVVAAPRISGWRCAADNAPAVPAKDYYGLIAVPLYGSASSVTCTFHPPGLRLGTAVGAVSLTAALLLGVSARRPWAGSRRPRVSATASP